ncbi:MAG TPA: tetratricopeptide repeat protein [Steroidobacteraceae bacterium]|jgi:TolB-like protein/thioredoxin-like negative regulator of GroEL
MPPDRLDSWKQIARHLGRSVRTVRRWEQLEDLPVRRHVHTSLASVYAFKAEVEAWQRARSRVPGSSRAGSPREVSIAVLPFASLNCEPGGAYFTEGLTEEVTSRLSRVAALRVISRTSALALRGTRLSAPAIGMQLGVSHLLEGSVRRKAGQLRVTAQLIDAATDAHIWAETFEGTADDVFAIQETLGRQIVSALEVRLTDRDRQRLAERPIDSVPAYECYLRARHESWRWRRDAIDRAVTLLRQGLALIGDNITLFAALGLAYLQYREAGVDLSEAPLQQAQQCAARIVALDARAAAGLQLRGWIAYARGHLQESVRDLRSALALEPNNADTLLLLCNCYLVSGRVTSARPLLARLLRVDPLTPLSRCMPAFADVMQGKLAAAVAPYQQMFEMDPSNPMGRLFYVWVLILNGKVAAARVIARGCPRGLRSSVPGQLMQFLMAAARGRLSAAQSRVSVQVRAAAASSDVFARFLAQGFALAGQPVAAIDWLEVAVARGFINYPFLARHDPSLVSLRGEPRFQRLLKDVRARWQRFRG